ncbi:MAG TPA: hypothetical protein DCY94_04075 [Firmicutes bacterium]|nr:hypothetical protein [Bacillota bacterium]
MSEEDFKIEAAKIFKNIFGREVDFDLDTIKKRYAFDVVLPKEVIDSSSGEVTYTAAANSKTYMTNDNATKRDMSEGWMVPKEDLHSLEDVVRAWEKTNAMTTERNYDSENVLKSDTIYNCQNVYCSMDSSRSKWLIFCDSCHDSEDLIASSRSVRSNSCIRCDDSQNCANSYGVICSNKISNSLFIQDCFDLYECMFCSHIASKKFVIANMQFEEDEYYQIKKFIVDWILGV